MFTVKIIVNYAFNNNKKYDEHRKSVFYLMIMVSNTITNSLNIMYRINFIPLVYSKY